MRRSLSTLIAVVVFAAPAAAQNVTIVYPIDGETYPITDPAPGALHSHYFTASFSVTCQGDHDVEWGFDGGSVGKARFYDMLSTQQVWKLPGGKHEFYVNAGRCGTERVAFVIGN